MIDCGRQVEGGVKDEYQFLACAVGQMEVALTKTVSEGQQVGRRDRAWSGERHSTQFLLGWGGNACGAFQWGCSEDN